MFWSGKSIMPHVTTARDSNVDLQRGQFPKRANQRLELGAWSERCFSL